MRAARFEVAPELLEDLLGLPSGARLIGAAYDPTRSSVTLVVDDPDLPEAPVPHHASPTARVRSWIWNLSA